ncbi:MAG: histidine kinase, partial [Deltaproteobacteria bacterium]|nr:histidine kinase [Deltaproteobacteria bacterium]
RREILESGCDDFIRKPYRETEIFEALAKHLGVRFLYAEEESPVAASGEIELDIEQLKRLQPELIKNLKEAAILLDEGCCFKAIGIISDDNHELGKSLRRMVENMQYNKILKTLDSLTGSETK